MMTFYIFDFTRISQGGIRERTTWGKAADFVAIPEQRARMFNATRSPRRILRTGPRTVAQCLIGVMVSPSPTCHSTLKHVKTW